MLVLTRSDTQGLLDLEGCLLAVERAFVERGAGNGLLAHRFHVPVGDGAFHVTAGGIGKSTGGPAFGIKMNGRYPPAESHEGQRVTGAIPIADGESGRPIVLLDSLLVTIVRTAAVTSLAVRHLARENARSVLSIGAGMQAPLQLAAMLMARKIEHVKIHDQVRSKARGVVELARARGVQADVVEDPDVTAEDADVIVTVTTAGKPVLTRAPVGATIIALGADAPGKRELGPRVMAQSKVVVDALEQAAFAGEPRKRPRGGSSHKRRRSR